MILADLAKYHPVLVEGMGYYDPRNPRAVATQIVSQLTSHWRLQEEAPSKPKLLITQGDPAAERGVSAITPIVSELLDIPRGLVVLDSDIDAEHAQLAPREGVIWEAQYSDMWKVLQSKAVASDLEDTVDQYLRRKNQQRQNMGKKPLQDYFKTYALLQEVTKAACLTVCGHITVAHTANEISPFSVTSFYQVGLDLQLLDYQKHYVPYGQAESIDFDSIDTR